MRTPDESGLDDQHLEHYLLRLLPDDEAERLDELSIVDEDIASRLLLVEHDLTDAFLRGSMPADMRARFESVYLASRHRRRRLEFSQNFVEVADASAVTADGAAEPAAGRTSGVESSVRSPGGASSRPSTWLRISQWGLAVAAALMLVAAALLVQSVALRNELRDVQSRRAAAERRARELELEIEAQRAQSANAARELERMRAALAKSPERTPASAVPGPDASSARTRGLMALVLLPQTRSARSMMTFVVPPGAESVAFDLRLDANDFRQYSVALKNPDTGEILWRSSRLAARDEGDRSTVAVIVPASHLRSQHYVFDLTGYRNTGDGPFVSSYTFRIERQ